MQTETAPATPHPSLPRLLPKAKPAKGREANKTKLLRTTHTCPCPGCRPQQSRQRAGRRGSLLSAGAAPGTARRAPPHTWPAAAHPLGVSSGCMSVGGVVGKQEGRRGSETPVNGRQGTVRRLCNEAGAELSLAPNSPLTWLHWARFTTPSQEHASSHPPACHPAVRPLQARLQHCLFHVVWGWGDKGSRPRRQLSQRQQRVGGVVAAAWGSTEGCVQGRSGPTTLQAIQSPGYRSQHC